MLVFAILTVGLGGLQLRNTIYGPFVVKAPKNSLATVSTNEEARLKNIDTDHDGLSDYDELYQYETSPYLPDSDSDGTNDKIEIENGSDPLCPEGKKCSTAATVTPTVTSSVASPLLNGTITPSEVLSLTEKTSNQNPNPQDTIDLEKIIADPVQLRAVILSTGKIDSATLDKIDDAALQAMARKLFSNATSTQ